MVFLLNPTRMEHVKEVAGKLPCNAEEIHLFLSQGINGAGV